MCISPLKGFQIGWNPSGKPQYKICSYDTDHVEYRKHGWYASNLSVPNSPKFVREFVEIPCGHCRECRLKYSREWADRLLLESLEHEHTWFITLTYSDANLPLNFDSDGVLVNGGVPHPTLVKKHVQDFLKRLRRWLEYNGYNDKIRYYCAGEYGDHTHRPHYHMVLFGMDIPDLVPYKITKLGFQLYNSNILNKIWSHGYVVIGQFTWETGAYVARYTMKKVNGLSKEDYINAGIQPEFAIMSRKPGIARNWFDANKGRFLEEAYVQIGDRQIRPNRYYLRLLEDICPEWYEDRKVTNRILGESRAFKKDKDFKKLIDSDMKLPLKKIRIARIEYEKTVAESNKKGFFRPEF